MAYNVEDLMELTDIHAVGFAIEYIREAFSEIAQMRGDTPITKDYDIIDGRVLYPLPSDINTIDAVSALQTTYGSDLFADTYFDGTESTKWTNTDMSSLTLTKANRVLKAVSDAADQTCYLNTEIALTPGLKYRILYSTTSSTTAADFEFWLETENKLFTFNTTQGSHYHEFVVPYIPTDSHFYIKAGTTTGTLEIRDVQLFAMFKNKYARIKRLMGDNPYEYLDERTTLNEQVYEGRISDGDYAHGDAEIHYANKFGDTSGRITTDSDAVLYDRIWAYQIIGEQIALYEFNVNEDQSAGYPVELTSKHYVPPTINVRNGMRVRYFSGDAIFKTTAGIDDNASPSETSIINARDNVVRSVIDYMKHCKNRDANQLDVAEYWRHEFLKRFSKAKNRLKAGPRIIITPSVYSIK